MTERLIEEGILIIYADGLFITRDYGSKLEAWYIGQINVFFHELDNIKTENTCVILTTNRLDLMDKAVLDRLFLFDFPPVPLEILYEKVDSMARQLDFFNEDGLVDAIKEMVSKGMKENPLTFRDIEKIVYEYYIEKIGGKDD